MGQLVTGSVIRGLVEAMKRRSDAWAREQVESGRVAISSRLERDLEALSRRQLEPSARGRRPSRDPRERGSGSPPPAGIQTGRQRPLDPGRIRRR